MITLFAAMVLVLIGFSLSVMVYAKGLRRMETTIDRMEIAAKLVAIDLRATAADLHYAASQRATIRTTLGRMEDATHVVASNLADSVSRADATLGPDGAAADAALRTGDTAAAITKRQTRKKKSE